MAEESAGSRATLSNLSTENRTLPAERRSSPRRRTPRRTGTTGPTPTARRSGPSRPTGCTGTQKWDQVLDWDAPFAKWFVGGKLNVAYNCVDRHVEDGHGDQVAFHWEGEPGDTRTITYADLQREVCKTANALTELGVRRRGPGGHPAADDPRGRVRDAGLRAARRDAQRGVRRVLRRAR